MVESQQVALAALTRVRKLFFYDKDKLNFTFLI